MLTGCPINGVMDKIVKKVEEMGADIVLYDGCSGPRSQKDLVDEDPNKDPFVALSEKTLRINCSVMTPNHGRIEGMREQIEEYSIDAVLEVTLQGCHTFAVEAFQIKRFTNEEMNIPYLHITTDFSQGDSGQIETRLGAFLEMIDA